MSFSEVVQYTKNESTSTPLDTLNGTTAISIATGDVLVGIFGWNGATTTVSCQSGAGENVFSMYSITDHSGNTDLHTAFGIKYGAVSHTAATMTFGLAAARIYLSFIVGIWRPDGGDTVTVNSHPAAVDANDVDTNTSGAINTSGTDSLAVVAMSEYSGREVETMSMAGAVVTYLFSTAFATHMGYKLYTSSQTGVAGGITLSGIADSTIEIISFDSAAGGEPGGGSVENIAYYIRRRA